MSADYNPQANAPVQGPKRLSRAELSDTIRPLFEELVRRQEAENYKGVSGKLKALNEWRDRIGTPHGTDIDVALGRELRQQLDWPVTNLSLSDATTVNAEGKALAESPLREEYMNIPGRDRFFAELRSDNKIKSKNPNHLQSAVDPETMRAMGWGGSGRLSEAELNSKLDTLFDELVQRTNVEDFKGVSGQLEVLKQWRPEIGSPNPLHVARLLGPERRQRMNWPYVQLPLDDALVVNSEGKALVGSPQNAEFMHIPGRDEFFAKLHREKKITVNDPDRLKTALDPLTMRAMDWGGSARLSREQLESKVIELYDKLLESPDVERYKGVSGKLEILNQWRLQIGNPNLRVVDDVLGLEGRQRMNWPGTRLPLREATTVNSEGKALAENPQQAAEFMGLPGRRRFFAQLHRDKKITTSDPDILKTALDPDTVRKMNWGVKDLLGSDAPLSKPEPPKQGASLSWPEKQALVRSRVEELLRGPQAEKEGYKGVSGKIDFYVNKLRPEIGSRHMSTVDDLVTSRLRREMNWPPSRGGVTMETAALVNSLSKTLPGRKDAAEYRGFVGEVRFLVELVDEHPSIEFNALGDLSREIDPAVRRAMGWEGAPFIDLTRSDL